MAEIAEVKQLKELEIHEFKDAFQIRTWHRFGVSVISLTKEEAAELKKEIGKWLSSLEGVKVSTV